MKAKGYNANAAKRNLTFEKFARCHQTFQSLKLSYKSFRGYSHRLFTIDQYKNVLSNFDSKLFVHSCNVHTSFYGSNLIQTKDVCYLCEKEAITYPFKNENFS